MRRGFAILAAAGVLLGAGIAAANHDRPFDFAHVRAALRYLQTPSEDALVTLAATGAAAHLKRHSDVTGYYPPEASPLDISRDLVTNDRYKAVPRMAAVKDLLQSVAGNRAKQEFCFSEAKAHLPQGFNFAHPLYVTWGYDIGVSMAGSSSLNIAHPHFAESPEEIWYYCIHEMHHAGVTSFHPFPMPIADIKTTAEMTAFIRYATFLEGAAVYAAYGARAEAGALADDRDYVALEDAAAIARVLADYAAILAAFEDSPERALTDADWEMIGPLSDGERLWYRAGAAMARKIDEGLGRAAYRRIIREGPDAFFSAWRASP